MREWNEITEDIIRKRDDLIARSIAMRISLSLQLPL